ncbi:MAG: tyrosine-type recombinase/integrase [Bacteroidales bacterium]|nr:tyrosine-type recombinase/integrase [Bacteroidales bacterium]
MAEIESYITYLRDVRRYSPRTQELYRSALEDFAVWAVGEMPGQAGHDEAGHDGKGQDGVVEELVPSRIREYEAWMIDNGLSARTVHLRMSAISGFCNFLMKGGTLKSNPVRTVKRPQMKKRLPECYTEKMLDEYLAATQADAGQDTLELLLQLPATDKTAVDLYRRRLRRLIISLLYASGIRRAELIGLKVGSVDPGRHTLRVLGKGDKMREIPLIFSVNQEISLYLQAASKMVGAERPADAPLLITEKGRSLYPEYVDRAVKAELSGYGITGRKSPHVLRHSLATALLDEGADLNAIKEMLGHESLAATEVYTHNSIERLKAQYINAHPRAKKQDSHD